MATIDGYGYNQPVWYINGQEVTQNTAPGVRYNIVVHNTGQVVEPTHTYGPNIQHITVDDNGQQIIDPLNYTFEPETWGDWKKTEPTVALEKVREFYEWLKQNGKEIEEEEESPISCVAAIIDKMEEMFLDLQKFEEFEPEPEPEPNFINEYLGTFIEPEEPTLITPEDVEPINIVANTL